MVKKYRRVLKREKGSGRFTQQFVNWLYKVKKIRTLNPSERKKLWAEYQKSKKRKTKKSKRR